MFLSRHIFYRNGYFYYRIVIPHDIRHFFPFREIKQSLKTHDKRQAEILALPIEANVQKCFDMLRSGLVSEDNLHQVLDSILPKISKRTSPSQIKLSSLMALYITQNEGNWSPKTKMEVESEFKLLTDILGDKSLISITRQMMLDLRSTLGKLPPNLYKKFPKHTIKGILAIPDLPVMSIVSVNKNMARMASILRYAVREGYLVRNVAESLEFPIKRKAEEERHAYSDYEIHNIIIKLNEFRTKLSPERFWIPMIAIHSGMRLEEICQLHVIDIIKCDGILCINITDEGTRRVKNLSSRRIIPIHPVLINMGLINYLDEATLAREERLWPNLTYNIHKGYSNKFVKWYQRFNREYVTQDKRKVFHSFRHSFANKLKQQGVAESLIAELMGHKNHSITTGRYGKRYEPQVLLDALLKVTH